MVEFDLTAKKYPFSLLTKNPGTLAACKDSRAKALKQYQSPFEVGKEIKQGAAIYFNPTIDTLFIRHSASTNFMRGLMRLRTGSDQSAGLKERWNGLKLHAAFGRSGYWSGGIPVVGNFVVIRQCEDGLDSFVASKHLRRIADLLGQNEYFVDSHTTMPFSGWSDMWVTHKPVPRRLAWEYATRIPSSECLSRLSFRTGR